MIPIQDYLCLGNEARMNAPATLGDNWKWRLTRGQISDMTLYHMREVTRIYGRLYREPVAEEPEEETEIEEAEEVKRFLFKPDNNYRITYVAAGVSSRENVDDAIELGFSGEELEIRKNELIFYVHGQKLMELAHNIYQRCCK